MAEQELMTWNKKNERWYKKHLGKQYCVTVGKLRKLHPDLVAGDSQSGSRKAANQWWRVRLEELSKPPIAETRVDQMIAWNQKVENLESAERLESERKEFASFGETYDPLKMMSEQGRAIWADRLETAAVVAASDSRLSADHNATIWLNHKLTAVKSGTLSAGHYNNLQLELKSFVGWYGEDRSIAEINGEVFLQYHDWLVGQLTAGKFKAHAAKRYQGTVKTWITWLYEIEKLGNLPRNLKNPNLAFSIPDPIVEPWTKDDLQFVLPFATDKPLELWLLLMANCGFTQVDVADLTHDQVDWSKGTITDRRGKTGDKSDKVPTVTFPLWTRTFKLLKTHRSSDPKFVLVNNDGNPLRVERIRDNDEEKAGTYTKYDNIQSQYYDLKGLIRRTHPKWEHKTLKQLRKTGASLFRGNPRFTSIYQLFLRHAHESIADKSYAAIPQALLTEGIDWLGKELGID